MTRSVSKAGDRILQVTALGDGAGPEFQQDATAPRRSWRAPTTVSVLFVGVLYLTATGRWGSYLSAPGAPLYVADIVLLLAVGQTALRMRRLGTSLRDLGAGFAGSHVALLLCAALLAWATTRALLGVGVARGNLLVWLRDLAPYGYAVAALLAFAWGPTRGRVQTRLVYAALTVHVSWLLVAPHLPGWPEKWPLLGDAPVLTARPDFDATVLGVAVALALHRLLLDGRNLRRGAVAALVAFASLNTYALSTMPSRAGLIACVITIGAALLAWTFQHQPSSQNAAAKRRRQAVFVVMLLTVVTLIAVSPAGQRLQEGVRGERGVATGTVQARQAAWVAVMKYVTADASRTAVGVGFGPNFLSDGGAEATLEGTEYQNVRSPHNYVIGTLARLGVAGAVFAAFLIVAAAALGVGRLRRSVATSEVFASLLVLSLPVPALLGVVLESPFGAVPYFWAIGYLAACQWGERHALPLESTGDSQAGPSLSR